MAKFYGEIGYTETKETSPGVWTEEIIERKCFGDVLKNTKRSESGEKLNDDVAVNNIFSILSDELLCQNVYKMRYIKWMGVSWKIISVDVQRPRLIFTIGGVYNG